jgi:DNA-binding PadR family transcriptional regulator
VTRRDEHGLTFDEEILDRRRQRYRLDADTSASLRALRGLGLVASRRPEGWNAVLWEITPEGRQWLRDDAAEFAQSVRATLDSLPVLV